MQVHWDDVVMVCILRLKHDAARFLLQRCHLRRQPRHLRSRRAASPLLSPFPSWVGRFGSLFESCNTTPARHGCACRISLTVPHAHGHCKAPTWRPQKAACVRRGNTPENACMW